MTPLARLRLAALVLMALIGGALLTPARGDDEKKEEKPDPKKIAKLIDQLGDEDSDKVDAAKKELLEMGEAAHEAVRKAAKDHPDADVRLRATLLEKDIARGAFRELRKMTGHEKWIRWIAVSKDGKRALTGSQDGTMRLWDVVAGKELKKFTGHTSWTWQVGFSSDEKQAISSGGTDKTVRLWDIEKAEEVKQYTGFPKRVYAAAISPDDKYVLAGEGGTDEGNNDIHLFNKETGKLERKLTGHTGYVWRAVFSPDSKKIASAGMNDSSFRIWDVESGKSTVVGKDAHENYVVAVAFSPKGEHLFTAGRDGKIKMWETDGGKLVKTFEGLKEEPEALAISKDGKRFLTTDGKSVVLFEVESGKIIHRFEEHTDQVLAVAFLPDGRKALSAGKDNTLRLWTVPK
jgi:WD40 repeat protein